MNDTGMKLTGKVFITGGAGTLGRAIIRRATAERWPCSFTVFSRDPAKHLYLQQEYPEVTCIIGDIRDFSDLQMAVTGHDILIHAAANKHIPQAERNVAATIGVNVTGSLNVAAAAVAAGVKRCLGISTDKVCYPVNVYGHSKALMERIFQEYNRLGLTTFHLCRYGNVLGSSGSVLNLWFDQLEAGLQPTLTDPEMTRFWLSEDDAVDIVLNALDCLPGSILVPLAGSCQMFDLLTAVVNDSGLEFDIIGRRPGEKKHEMLITPEEAQYTVLDATDGRFALILEEEQEPENMPTLVADGYRSNDPVHVLTSDEIQDMVAAL